MGRFVGRDPIESPGNNHYVYCYNTPARALDGYGLSVEVSMKSSKVEWEIDEDGESVFCVDIEWKVGLEDKAFWERRIVDKKKPRSSLVGMETMFRVQSQLVDDDDWSADDVIAEVGPKPAEEWTSLTPSGMGWGSIESDTKRTQKAEGVTGIDVYVTRMCLHNVKDPCDADCADEEVLDLRMSVTVAWPATLEFGAEKGKRTVDYSTLKLEQATLETENDFEWSCHHKTD